MKRCDFRLALSPLHTIAVLLFLAGAQSNTSTAQQLSAADIAAAKAAYQRPPPRPVENPALVELGRLLFWDPRASASGRTACVSCHLPQLGWAVNDPRSRNNSGKLTSRKSPTLLGVGHSVRIPNGWDGRNATPRSPGQSVDRNRIDVDAGDRDAGEGRSHRGTNSRHSRLCRAVQGGAAGHAHQHRTRSSRRWPPMKESFEPGPAPFDRWVDGDEAAISEPAKRGFVLFNDKALCFACHVGWRFTDDGFHDIGTSTTDLGRGREVKNDPQLQYRLQDADLALRRLARALYAQRLAGRPRCRDQALRKGRTGSSQPVSDDDAGAARSTQERARSGGLPRRR